MDTLANKPAGSVIGITLSWPAPTDASVRRYIDVPLLALWLCGWAVGGMLTGPAHPRLPILSAIEDLLKVVRIQCRIELFDGNAGLVWVAP